MRYYLSIETKREIAKMNMTDANTILSIEADVKEGRRTLKVIAAECRIFETQTNDEFAQSVYARLSDCKTRAQFQAVIKSVI